MNLWQQAGRVVVLLSVCRYPVYNLLLRPYLRLLLISNYSFSHSFYLLAPCPVYLHSYLAATPSFLCHHWELMGACGFCFLLGCFETPCHVGHIGLDLIMQPRDDLASAEIPWGIVNAYQTLLPIQPHPYSSHAFSNPSLSLLGWRCSSVGKVLAQHSQSSGSIPSILIIQAPQRQKQENQFKIILGYTVNQAQTLFGREGTN